MVVPTGEVASIHGARAEGGGIHEVTETRSYGGAGHRLAFTVTKS
jgi:hypothetical protein